MMPERLTLNRIRGDCPTPLEDVSRLARRGRVFWRGGGGDGDRRRVERLEDLCSGPGFFVVVFDVDPDATLP